jgi:F0F1-type ATP synthase delta subunit
MAISITNTYSSILFELGKKHNSLKTYFDNANSLIVIINQNDVFKSFLINNVIDKKDKKDILKDICSSIFDINFIYFL